MKANLTALIIILSCGLTAMKVFETASTHTRAIRQPTWSPPDIPRCDKELWLRIKDGCSDQGRSTDRERQEQS